MSNSDDLETRVTNLEDQVAQLQGHATLAISEAGAARLLAAGADQDVSTVRAELRAHTQVLNALRETQLETREIQLEQGRAITGLRHDLADQGTMIISLDQRVTGLDNKVTGLDNKVTGLDQTVAGLDQKVAGLDNKVTGLDQTVTGLGNKVTGLDQTVTGLDQKVTGLDQKVAGLDQKVTGLDNKVTGLDQRMTAGFETLNTGMMEIKALLTGKSGSEET